MGDSAFFKKYQKKKDVKSRKDKKRKVRARYHICKMERHLVNLYILNSFSITTMRNAMFFFFAMPTLLAKFPAARLDVEPERRKKETRDY